MSVIKVLDKHVAELIAAGEVVERPSSAIKELVENSIDAGATNITVEIKNGGTTFMRVHDNGCGIMREDIQNAFLPHATSKVHSENDLDKISTLGFRGEALASISAVSNLEIITKNKKDEIGTSYTISGGEPGEIKDAGCPQGTTIIIRNLFYNIPARLKFLKKDVSEGNSVSYVIDKIALSHPEVAITYIKDEKLSLKTSGDGKLLSAIYAVYGKDFANSLIPVDYTLNSVHVFGFVSRPVNARPNRNMQNFFINGRFVKSGTATAAIEQACKGSVMVGKFPSCVININLSFEAVDVNVHPSKIEVRFVNERPIFDAVYHAVKSALLKGDKLKEIELQRPSPNTLEKQNTFKTDKNTFNHNAFMDKQKNTVGFEKQNNVINQSDISLPKAAISPLKKFVSESDIDSVSLSDSTNILDVYSNQIIKNSKKEENYSKSRVDINIEYDEPSSPKNNDICDNDSISYTQKPTENEKLSEISEDEIDLLIEQPKSSIRYIGEALSTYIIIERNSNEILLIDKHAAHERIIYERLKKEKGTGYSQMLLEPVAVTLNKIDYNNILQNIEVFKQAGFEVEDFGNGVILVRWAPQYLEKTDITDTILEMAGYLSEDKKDINTEKMDWIFHNIACRCAIKAGNKNSKEELMEIVNQLEKDNTLRYCPHGRPVCIVLTKHEIEKQFGRV